MLVPAKGVEDAVEAPEATVKKKNNQWRVVDIVVASVVSVAVGAIFWAWSAGYAGIVVEHRGVAVWADAVTRIVVSEPGGGVMIEGGTAGSGTAVVSVTHDEEFIGGSCSPDWPLCCAE